MKEIRGFSDLAHIIERRCPIIDNHGFTIKFEDFMHMSIKEVVAIFDHGWKYNPTI